jgi:hypothetical protein
LIRRAVRDHEQPRESQAGQRVHGDTDPA